MLSLLIVISILLMLMPAAVMAADDIYCRVGEAVFLADGTAVDTSLPGIQNVNGTNIHVGVPKIDLYDSFENQAGATLPGTATTIAQGGSGWIKLSTATQPVYTAVDGEIVTNFAFSPDTNGNYLAYYTFNRSDNTTAPGIGRTGKFAIEFKVRADAPVKSDIRFINSTASGFTTNQMVYSYLDIRDGKLTLSNVTKNDGSVMLPSAPVLLNEWATVRFDFDTAAHCYDFYVNGKLVKAKNSFFAATEAEKTGNLATVDVAYMNVTNAKNSQGAYDTANFQIDDIAVYDISSDENFYFGEVTPASYSFTQGTALKDIKLPVAVSKKDGTSANVTAYVPVRMASVDSKNAGKYAAKIDGYTSTAPVTISKTVRSFYQNFQGSYANEGSHTIEADTATGNKYLQIKKNVNWGRIAPNLKLNPKTDEFKLGFRFRLPNLSGFASDRQRPTFQISADNNTPILEIAFDPYNDDGVSPYNRIRVINKASADGSVAEGAYSFWANEYNSSFDWTAWHTLEVIFKDAKAAISLDGNILSVGKQGAAYQWTDVRTDINFNLIRFAHRFDSALNIDAITNLDDFYVDVNYTSLTEDITAEPMSFPLNNTTVNSSNATAEYATLGQGNSFEYTVNTKEGANYLLTYTGGTVQEVVMDVLVNGMPMLENVKTANTNSYGERNPHELGVIELMAGKNIITFKSKSGSIVSTQFTLSKARRTLDIPVNSNNITSYKNVTLNGDYASLSYSEGAEAYIETEIPVLQEGWYGVTVNASAPQNLSLRVSADESATQRALKSTSSFENNYLGMLYLTEGTHTLRISPVAGSGNISSVNIGDIDYDLLSQSRSLAIEIDKETVSAMNNVAASDATDASVTLKNNAGFTICVNAEKALNYSLGAQYVNAGGTSKVDVTVNGYKQISGADADSSIGYINLNRGLNEITVSLASGDALTVDSLSLSLADSFIDGEHKMWVQENRVANATFSGGSNAGFSTIAGSPCATMRQGSYVEFDVYTNQDRYAYLTLDTASPDEALINISVDGKVMLSERTQAVSYNYSTFGTYEMKTLVFIPKGYSTIRYTQVDFAGNLRSLTFNEHTGDKTVLRKFELQMENGVRVPYVVRDGFTGYAAAEVLKLGNPVDAYSLMIAQYDNSGKLVGVKKTDIDVSDMKDRETKTFRVPLTYKGSGGEVKGFILEKDTLIPEENAIICDEPQFFPNTLFDETITYTLATNVKNSAGEYYKDYSVHDEKYDIDAIFYDSVVGQQTKVFAYIGIPKGASEENPVPAVVCVHGGGGVAYIDWVKKWNDEGYAAIAMTLSGDGPAATSEADTDLTPYRGQTCWGNNAFIKDYQNASMYQNVINVVRAHTLLRQWPGVDETKTGITGISWGGVTTTTTIGVDNRFKFAIPVYGGGYLDLDETYFAAYIKTANSTLKWDPANFAAKSTMPVLFINGDSDHSFSINTTSLTESVTPDARLSIRHGFSHSHVSGWGPQEIYVFAKSILSGKGDPFITIETAATENQQMAINYSAPSGVTVERAELYYITDAALPYGGEINWKKITTYTNDNSTVVFNLPEDATFCYATLIDNNTNRISTNYTQVK